MGDPVSASGLKVDRRTSQLPSLPRDLNAALLKPKKVARRRLLQDTLLYRQTGGGEGGDVGAADHGVRKRMFLKRCVYI